MTSTIRFYEIFWDAKLACGGVDLVLGNGRLARLTTQQPSVLELWTKLLQTEQIFYYCEEGSEGLRTGIRPDLSRRPSADRPLNWLG